MGALLFTVLWVAMVPLGVFVLVNTVASVRNGDTDAVRNGLLLDIVYLLFLIVPSIVQVVVSIVKDFS